MRIEASEEEVTDAALYILGDLLTEDLLLHVSSLEVVEDTMRLSAGLSGAA